MLRTGILLPRSTLFPSIGLDMLEGLKQNLKHQKSYDTIRLATGNIGFGINEQNIYSKAEHMLLQDDCDVVVLCADTRITEMLEPLFTASNKILLVLNFGANFPDSWQPAPTTIIHSLNFCLHAGLTGKLAALENNNKEVVNLVSYYDGGYRQCYSMLSTNQDNGGVPVLNHVTSGSLKEFTLDPLVDFLEQQPEIKTLLCLFTGDQAERFYKEISPLQKKLDLHLYVSPMMFEPSLKKAMGNEFGIDNVKGYVPWHASLTNTANWQFKKNCRAVNYFSLLGWETGTILREIYREDQSGVNDAASVVASLVRNTYDSPRGWMKIDPATNHSYGPSYLARCRNNTEITIEGEAKIEEEWKAFTRQRPLTGERSGWKNTYLCI